MIEIRELSLFIWKYVTYMQHDNKTVQSHKASSSHTWAHYFKSPVLFKVVVIYNCVCFVSFYSYTITHFGTFHRFFSFPLSLYYPEIWQALEPGNSHILHLLSGKTKITIMAYPKLIEQPFRQGPSEDVMVHHMKHMKQINPRNTFGLAKPRNCRSRFRSAAKGRRDFTVNQRVEH